MAACNDFCGPSHREPDRQDHRGGGHQDHDGDDSPVGQLGEMGPDPHDGEDQGDGGGDGQDGTAVLGAVMLGELAAGQRVSPHIVQRQTLPSRTK